MNITWNAKEYKSNFSFVPDYGESVLNLIKAPKGSSVVDLGCGNGSLTSVLAERGYRVTGIDDSSQMLSLAKESYPELDFKKANALTFKEANIDVIFSNAVFHWIDKDKQQALLDNIYANLNKDGELVFEMGGKGCAELIHSTLKKIFNSLGLEYKFAFYFPTIGEYSAMLEKAGFTVTDAFWFERPTRQKGSISDWINMFNKHPFENIDDKTKCEILTECEKELRPKLFIDGSWYVDYTRLRMRCVKR